LNDQTNDKPTTPSGPSLRPVEFTPPAPGVEALRARRDRIDSPLVKPIDLGAAVDRARHAVYMALTKQVREYPNLDIDGLRPSDSLSPLDAAFAHAVYDATIRRWITIEYLLKQHMRQEWDLVEPRVRAALMGGAAQILFLTKVPPRAAVHSTVEWTKQRVRPGAGAMVNAVLRRIAEEIHINEDDRVRDSWTDRSDEIPLSDGRALALAVTRLPDDPIGRIAVATSHPASLLRSWMKHLSMREVRALATHGLAQPPIILNTQHAREPIPLDLAKPHAAPGHHLFLGSREDLIELLAARDDVWVQDPASSLAVQSVLDLNPSLVIDACAGQGTKTRQLAAAFPNAKIIATDIHDARRETLKKTFAGSEQVEVVLHKRLIDYSGKADLVFLDVPCSNTGVLARRVEARYRFGDETLTTLVNTQRQILADSIRLIFDGSSKRGQILYSTCSLERAENEDQVAWMERWHAMKPSRVNRRSPEGGPGKPPETYTDGAFAALLS
jgi:16S rRNA (cytosine967-C5)-methyltransferase